MPKPEKVTTVAETERSVSSAGSFFAHRLSGAECRRHQCSPENLRENNVKYVVAKKHVVPNSRPRSGCAVTR